MRGFLLDDFKRFGVDTDWMLRRERAASAMTIIMVSPEGERAHRVGADDAAGTARLRT